MSTGVIFANPPASAREGQKKRGMLPLPMITLANSLNDDVKIEQASPDLLPEGSPAVYAVAKSDAEWLAVTCYQETMNSVIELAKIAKAGGKKVVLGGAHVSLWGGERILIEIPQADFAIVGEGETPFKMLVMGCDPNQIPGLWWRENGRPKTNNLPVYFHEWVNQPSMIHGYSSFDYSELWRRNERIGRTGYRKPFSVMGVRGCAYALKTGKRCTFCAMPLGNRFRCRSPRYFWEEINWAVNHYDVDLIWDHSDSLLGSPSWLAKLAEVRPLGLPPIWCYGRADEIQPDTVELISKIGIEHIYIGVEVGSDGRLEEIRKGISLKQVLLAVKLCKEYGIRTQLSFIVGLPGETEESLNDSISFALLCGDEGVDDIVFHEFILRKGLRWFEALSQEYPELDHVIVDQGKLQDLFWQQFNPLLDRESAIVQVQATVAQFPHSELTAWNI